MTKISLIIKDVSAKAKVVKVVRSLYPETSMRSITANMDAGKPVAELVFYQSDEDDSIRRFGACLDRLEAECIGYSRLESNESVSLGPGMPPKDYTSIVGREYLNNILQRRREIAAMEERFMELEGDFQDEE